MTAALTYKYLDYNFMKESELQPLGKTAPEFLTHTNSVIVNVHCSKLLCIRVVFYLADLGD